MQGEEGKIEVCGCVLLMGDRRIAVLFWLAKIEVEEADEEGTASLAARPMLANFAVRLVAPATGDARLLFESLAGLTGGT